MASYFGVDVGTAAGWARVDVLPGDRATWSHGSWDLSITDHESRSLRFEKFAIQLRAHLAIGIDKLFYERIHMHKGVTAAHIYGGLLAKLQECCDAYDTPYEGLSVQAIKKFATGKGNAGKPEMVRAVAEWGFATKSHDEADAIAILRLGMENHT